MKSKRRRSRNPTDQFSEPGAGRVGSLTYILYGVANKFTVGAIPTLATTSSGLARAVNAWVPAI